MSSFITDFQDAYRLLMECELTLTARQLSDELEWPNNKRTSLDHAAHHGHCPEGLYAMKRNGVWHFGVKTDDGI